MPGADLCPLATSTTPWALRGPAQDTDDQEGPEELAERCGELERQAAQVEVQEGAGSDEEQEGCPMKEGSSVARQVPMGVVAVVPVPVGVPESRQCWLGHVLEGSERQGDGTDTLGSMCNEYRR